MESTPVPIFGHFSNHNHKLDTQNKNYYCLLSLRLWCWKKIFFFFFCLSYLQVFDDIDHLSGGVWVSDGSLIGHWPQFSKRGHQFLQRGVRNVWTIAFQHLQLSAGFWIVHSMAAEDITCSVRKTGRGGSLVDVVTHYRFTSPVHIQSIQIYGPGPKTGPLSSLIRPACFILKHLKKLHKLFRILFGKIITEYKN